MWNTPSTLSTEVKEVLYFNVSETNDTLRVATQFQAYSFQARPSLAKLTPFLHLGNSTPESWA